MTYEQIVADLRAQKNPKNIEGMARFGINPKNTLGISIPYLRALAKQIKKDLPKVVERHELARKLWESEIHEGRILAAFIDDPELITNKQMDSWVAAFDSWDVCDQVCSNLFDKTNTAFEKAGQWAKSDREFVRRAGFALMAALAVHDKKASDADFTQFFPLIKKYSIDERNFVRKAVNWALRQIGKRNQNLHRLAIETAKEIGQLDSKSARWIAKDALRELQQTE